jgi:hypothetical protein
VTRRATALDRAEIGRLSPLGGSLPPRPARRINPGKRRSRQHRAGSGLARDEKNRRHKTTAGATLPHCCRDTPVTAATRSRVLVTWTQLVAKSERRHPIHLLSWVGAARVDRRRRTASWSACSGLARVRSSGGRFIVETRIGGGPPSGALGSRRQKPGDCVGSRFTEARGIQRRRLATQCHLVFALPVILH